jgi:hypothetical protein
MKEQRYKYLNGENPPKTILVFQYEDQTHYSVFDFDTEDEKVLYSNGLFGKWKIKTRTIW